MFGDRDNQETKKVPADTQEVPQRKEGTGTESNEKSAPAGGDQPADADNKSAEQNDGSSPVKSLNAPDKTAHRIETLVGLDRKLTGQSRPDHTRLTVRSGLGRVAIARRVVQPRNDWDQAATARLVQK
jgi:hypothetical protein